MNATPIISGRMAPVPTARRAAPTPMLTAFVPSAVKLCTCIPGQAALARAAAPLASISSITVPALFAAQPVCTPLIAVSVLNAVTSTQITPTSSVAASFADILIQAIRMKAVSALYVVMCMRVMSGLMVIIRQMVFV